MMKSAFKSMAAVALIAAMMGENQGVGNDVSPSDFDCSKVPESFKQPKKLSKKQKAKRKLIK